MFFFPGTKDTLLTWLGLALMPGKQLKKKKKNFNMPQREKKYDGGKRKLQRAAVVRQNHEDVQIIQGQPARRVQTDGKISRQSKIRGRDMNASTPERKMMQ